MDSQYESVIAAWEALYDSVREANYAGYDPYDGLNSRLFRSIPLYSNWLARLLWIQFFRRCPINLRPIVRIPREPNPKGLGLFISGLTKRYLATGEAFYLEEAQRLSDRVSRMATPGWAGVCWGYNFDWQARVFFVPQGTPNIIATSFVIRGLLDLYETHSDPFLLEVARRACDFIRTDLIREEEGGIRHFSYIPGPSPLVHNASLLGAASLARVYAHTGDSMLKSLALEVAGNSVHFQREDGAWSYGELPFQRWIDSFHTGYNLVALKEVESYTRDARFHEAVQKGYRYYVENFFLENGCPKYYHDRVYPVDIHACAQAIITPLVLCEGDMNALALARRTLEWTLRNMQKRPGQFLYQRYRVWSNPISYMRWGQAWMFYALSYFLLSLK